MEILTQIGLPLILLTVMIFGWFSLVFVPIVPGLTVIWAAQLVFGLVNGFNSTAAIILFVISSVLMIAGSLVDNVLMGASATKTGASLTNVTVALVAGAVGSIFLPLFGGILLSLAALFGLEYWRRRNWRSALESTKSMALGCGWAVVVRFGMGFVMIALYLAWVFWAR
jgi:uncharacterized protein YqgC (DUF456 family)